jgi:Type II CAAX prenyl endopeptidase Rce1-like
MNERTLPSAWRIAAVWALLSMLGAALAMPFLLAVLDGFDAPNRPSTPVLVLVLLLQTGIGSFFLAWGGTAAGRKLGVGSPVIEAWLSKRRVAIDKSFGVAALLGAVGGLSIIALDAAFAPHMPASIRMALPQPTPLHGLLASFYGGISEEVLMRLGATTMAAWLIANVIGFEGRRRTISLGFGVVFGALLFGVGHLPLAFTLWPASAVVVARTLLLNGVVGVVAGVVYVRRGIEHAIVLHFAADIVLYVIAPIVRMMMRT